MRLENASFLAPISEYSNLPFRQMCLDAGAGFAEVPLVSVIAIKHSTESIGRIDLSESEKGRTGIQLFGKEPNDFGNAIDAISKRFPFAEWFDINCGCPTDNVTASGGGAALLKAPKQIAEILKECRNHCKVVSAKVRINKSWDRTLEICKSVERSGADFITVHGRIPEQGYSGKADWGMIKKIKESLSIPVIGNGDIISVAQGKRLVEDGYCNGFMIGRGAMSNPYIFKGEESKGFEARKAMLLDYIERCEKLGNPDIAGIRMKALFFLRGFPDSAEIRNAVSRLKKIDEITNLLESY